MNAQIAHDLSEQGLVPDAIIRHGIRRLLQQRLEAIQADDVESAARAQYKLIQDIRTGPVAALPEKANEQHYEIPSAFFKRVLGNHLKYSCCYWPDHVTDLDGAEAAALEATCRRAGLEDGMRILELGCGWGSLTLWMARHLPNSRITAVSNSSSQREFIQNAAERQGLRNVELITADMNEFAPRGVFDRVVSLEMFEHMRNWGELYRRISHWLTPEGELFIHIFVHRSVPYLFEDRDASDWMSRYFFSGGLMPSADFPLLHPETLRIEQRWQWSGTHYEKTANAWLANMDRHKSDLWPLMEETYGADFSKKWWMRWRMFFMACAELFGYREGQEWFVGHYRLRNRREG